MVIDDSIISEQVRIAAGLDSLSDMQRDRIKRWSPILQRMISDRFSGLGSLDQASVEYVISEVISDQLMRTSLPGQTSREVAVDDARVVDRFDVSGAGRLSIWDDLWELLTPSDHRSRGAFAITPTYSPDMGMNGWGRDW